MIRTEDIYSTPPPDVGRPRKANGGILLLMALLLPLVGWRLVDPAEIGRSPVDVLGGVGLVVFVTVVEATRRQLRRVQSLAAETLDEPVQRGARLGARLAGLGGAGHDERRLAGRAEQQVGQRVRRLVVDL